MRVESYLLVYLFRRAKFGTDPSSLTRPLCFRPYQQNKRARKSVQFSSLRSSVWVIQEYVARLVLRWSQSETNKTQLAYRRRSSSSLYKCLLSYKRRICLKSFLELVDPPPPRATLEAVRWLFSSWSARNWKFITSCSKLRKWRQNQVIGLRKSHTYLLNSDHICMQ